MLRLSLALLLAASGAVADTVVPTRTIRPKEIIGAADVTVKSAELPGAFRRIDAVIGQEARVALYAGRPINPGDIGPPALVDRNDLVTLVYDTGLLTISTDGRALGRGAVGELIRVMNLSSRSTVSGRIRSDGSIEVN
ncbi:flagellar basal body P-ring formation chaperone FlgA [Lutimaribacter marinistellae]|uniref:Flagella basal body P-ring formation protein FlgA n=1 Tax=Lutimaribacter marinistellae TaxID=1820329 RepID=A0ABV7TF06_9RHOB